MKGASDRRPWPKRRVVAGRATGSALVVVAFAMGLAACGVPSEDRANVIAADDLPFGLASDATTSTLNPLIDQAAFGLETVKLYFPSEEGFVLVPRQLPSPATLLDVVNALSVEPNDAENRYRSAVGAGDVMRISVRGGVATVELDKSFLDLPTSEQRVAVAQLVLSLTAQPGVGQIIFTIDAEPVQVPRSDGTLRKGPVSRDDFVQLLRP